MYVTTFSKPAERVFLLRTETAAIVASGGNGRDYLLWLRGGTLLAQEFDTGALKLRGEPQAIAGPIPSMGVIGGMPVSASASGQLLYHNAGLASQLTWFDQAGTPLGERAKRMYTPIRSAFRLMGTALLQRVTDPAAAIFGCWTWSAAPPAGSPRRVTEGRYPQYAMDWSRDGRFSDLR